VLEQGDEQCAPRRTGGDLERVVRYRCVEPVVVESCSGTRGSDIVFTLSGTPCGTKRIYAWY
jgi:hypothetical protein